MAQRRFDERPRRRRPGAGRPRKTTRTGAGPVDAEIVGAAAHLFATHGIGATTMAQIAEAVGLEVSSIYYYFSSKHEVLERIVVDVNRVPLRIAADVQLEFPDAARRLHAFIRRDVAALCDFPFDFNEIHRLARDDRGNFTRYWADREQLLVEVEAIVRQGIDDGVFGPADPELDRADRPGERRGGAELVPAVDRRDGRSAVARADRFVRRRSRVAWAARRCGR